MKSVRDVLLSGQDFLIKTAGFPSAQARRELEDLLAALLKCKRLDVYLRFDQPLREPELEKLRGWLKRRSQREPLQWLLGSVEFLGAAFPVGQGVFIPRPETEEWVDWLIKLPSEIFPQQIAPNRILEIGVGSGIICCSLLRYWQKATAVGIDCNEQAIAATQKVAEQLGVADRLTLQHLKAGKYSVTNPSEKFDLIVSNPPYIPLQDRDQLEPEVLNDPAEALFGGEDGLDPYRSFAKKLPGWGVPGAAFAFEIGIGQSSDVTELLKPIAASTMVRNDLAAIPRVVAGVLK